MAQGVPDLRHGRQDGVCGLDQRVEAAQSGKIGRGGGPVENRSERAAAPARRRQGNGGFGVRL